MSLILQQYFENPELVSYPRELARKTGLHPNTTLKEIKQLEKEGLLTVKKGKAITTVTAVRNEKFRQRKILYNIRKIFDSDITNHLKKYYNTPEAIILFGSYAKGEDAQNSDVDIAVLTHNEEIPITKAFEKKLQRTIQIIPVNKLSNAFFETLANGIVLEGHLEWKN